MANTTSEKITGTATPTPGTEFTSAPAVSEKKTIAVDADVLQRILDNQKIQADTIDTLTKAVSANKLAQVVNSKKPKELPRMFLKVFRGKVVTGWRTAASRYIYGTSGTAPIAEVLQSIYHFSDGSETEPLDQVEFTHEDTRLWCRLQEGIKAIQDPDVRMYTLIAEQLETSDEVLRNEFVMPTDAISIDRNFVNP